MSRIWNGRRTRRVMKSGRVVAWIRAAVGVTEMGGLLPFRAGLNRWVGLVAVRGRAGKVDDCRTHSMRANVGCGVTTGSHEGAWQKAQTQTRTQHVIRRSGDCCLEANKKYNV